MNLLLLKQIARQLLRYSLVGAGSNAIGYGLYLIITSIGISSVQAMSLVYISASAASFVGNKKWTFSDSSPSIQILHRYIASQIAGYLTNLTLLLVLYRRFGFPHQWVQLLAVVAVAIELFLLSKYFIFRGVKSGLSMNDNNGPFPQSAFRYLAATESRHWWFRARNQIIIWTLRPRVRGVKNFLEVGCGTGFVISGIAKAFPWLELEASEYFKDGLVVAGERIPQGRLRQLDATAMEDENAYDCIGSFDVIEHIEDDECVLWNFNRALRTGGFLLLTVPQHPWLWSTADEYAHHKRRYTYPDLRRKVLNAGFRIEYCTSFVSLLLPLMAAQRLISRHKNYNPDDEFKIRPLLNAALYLVMQLELTLLQLGLRFPAGGSLLLLARKHDPVQQALSHR